MIIDVHKYLIFGKQEEMSHFFQLAQKGGFLEFLGTSHKKALELPEEAKNILAAIKIARHYAPNPEHDRPSYPLPEELASEILQIHSSYEKLFEEARILSAEISRISIFGDFSKLELDQLEKEAKRVFQFFCMKSDLARELTLPPEMIFVGTEYDLDYFIAIHKERTQYPKMIEILIDQPVGQLRERLQFVRDQIALLERKLHDFANALPHLQEGLIHCLNEHHLQLAKHDATTLLEERLFAIEAWVPETKIKALHGLLSGLDVQCEPIAVESKDQIPTYMENRGVAKLGEDLVHVYDTPAPTDKDPSSWILVFFSIFFAMIVSDAGYGLLYLALGLYLKWKYPKISGTGKRFVKLTLIISTCCIVWGILTASFFGIEIGPNNPFRKTSFIHYLAMRKAEYHVEQKDDVYETYVHEFPAVASAQDGHDFLLKASKEEGGSVKYEALSDFYDSILMEFSLLMGILHLSLSFIRYLNRNWAGMGWVVFMIGGYLFFPSILNATTLTNILGWMSKPTAYMWGEQMVYGGILLAFGAALIQRKWGAFHELMNVVQVFADVLSYLRLYALALAGMIMANTFNSIGVNAGFFAGALIILIGHLVNVTLAIMGGVIHGLRLNFLEWYHYSFEGGGRLFNPLRLRKAK